MFSCPNNMYLGSIQYCVTDYNNLIPIACLSNLFSSLEIFILVDPLPTLSLLWRDWQYINEKEILILHILVTMVVDYNKNNNSNLVPSLLHKNSMLTLLRMEILEVTIILKFDCLLLYNAPPRFASIKFYFFCLESCIRIFFFVCVPH